ncbi:hypothetical protein [Acetobacter sp. UBA5411]|uniref:hypothetical protein n=1 Tax=Acetobacter sp. UBA5411 TaxID=1945905 RepID=UPI0025BBF341|nr:hypothetical protein [Acetobacter sp. UBA5411]
MARTREEQIADIVSCLRFDNSGFAPQTLAYIAEKFIEEAEDRIRRGPVTTVDTQVLTAAREMTKEQKKLPEWVWLNPDTGLMSLGRWPRVSGNHHAPYIRADLALEAEQRGYERAQAECAEDTKRLEWLENIAVNTEDVEIHCSMNTSGETSFGVCGTGNYEETLRSAIDAAMKEDGQ